MTSRHAGLAIALAAILVQAPRLVLALLAADRLPVAPAAERALLVLAGIGTALVLTGGNLFLAHTVAQVHLWRRTLVAAWIAVLAASGGLALPLLVAGLSARSMPQVLCAGHLEWPWALLASIAHEVTAAGCVLASAAWAGMPAATVAGSGAARFVARAMPAGPGPVPADAGGPLPAPPGTAASPRSADRAAAADAVPCRAGCGRSFFSRQGEIAHLRRCPRRQARPVSEPPAS
jgi:hypothetical protein